MPVACTVSSFSPGEISKQPAHPSIKPFRPSSFFSLFSIVRPTQISAFSKRKVMTQLNRFSLFLFFLGKLCKPLTLSPVCITVLHSPNPSCVYIRQCKHRKRFLLLKNYPFQIKYLWPGTGFCTLTLYRLMEKFVNCPFTIRLKQIMKASKSFAYLLTTSLNPFDALDKLFKKICICLMFWRKCLNTELICFCMTCLTTLCSTYHHRPIIQSNMV